jgi:hypothetical protein
MLRQTATTVAGLVEVTEGAAEKEEAVVVVVEVEVVRRVRS